jgi:cell division protein FtsA
MKNIETAFRNHTHIDKIRIAKFVSQTINSTNEDINAHDAKMNTILGILAKGDMNCAGSEIKADLFSSTTESKPTVTTADIHQKPRTLTETIGSGVVRTEAEKIKAEEEEKKKKEAEIAAQIKIGDDIPKNPSALHKTIKGLKGFFQKMIADEE